MKFKDHCLECENKLGYSFDEVHKYLDEFSGSKEYGMRHRRKRHHLQGIIEIIKLFGLEAGEAAKIHIISDLREEGWTEKDKFPMNEDDYIKMGLF